MTPVLEVVFDFQKYPIIIPDTRESYQITGFIKDNAAGDFDGIRVIILGRKPLEGTVFSGDTECLRKQCQAEGVVQIRAR